LVTGTKEAFKNRMVQKNFIQSRLELKYMNLAAEVYKSYVMIIKKYALQWHIKKVRKIIFVW
jgi:hypothetical protein